MTARSFRGDHRSATRRSNLMYDPETHSTTARRRSGTLAVSLCAVVLVVCVFHALAQSGRKPPKKPSTTETQTSTQSPPVEQTPAPQDSKPRIPVMVVKSNMDAFVSSMYPSVVIEGCLERLHESPAVDART